MSLQVHKNFKLLYGKNDIIKQNRRTNDNLEKLFVAPDLTGFTFKEFIQISKKKDGQTNGKIIKG